MDGFLQFQHNKTEAWVRADQIIGVSRSDDDDYTLVHLKDSDDFALADESPGEVLERLTRLTTWGTVD